MQNRNGAPQVDRRNLSAAPTDGERSNLYGNSEEQICDLVRASELSFTVLEQILLLESLSTDLVAKDCPLVASDLVMIGDQASERIIFAAWEVHKRVVALKDHFYAGGEL